MIYFPLRSTINGLPLSPGLPGFEVKNELMVQRTGNVAIEIASRGNPSGIFATRSNFWLEKIRNDFYIIKTFDLKKKLFNAGFDNVRCGGDKGSNTCFFLIKEAKFVSWCTKIS